MPRPKRKELVPPVTPAVPTAGIPEVKMSSRSTLDDAPPEPEPEPEPSPVPATPPAPDDDMPAMPSERVKDSGAPFVTSADVRSTAPETTKLPSERGFITELIAGAGMKLHETEYALTGDPVFVHRESDERIWVALGRYVESQLDISKYGIIILLVILLGSESMKVAIYAQHRSEAQKRMPKKEGATKE